MYKIYFNNKVKETLKKEKLNKTKIIAMMQEYLQDNELKTKQDIICVLELPENLLTLMGSKDNQKIEIIHATSKVFIA
jgi:hypothetical protein